MHGAAAGEGEADKHRRYGTGVAPLVFETRGRVGEEGLHLLVRLRRMALDYGRRAPGGSATEQPIMQVKTESDTERSHVGVSDQQSAVLPDNWVEKISRSTGKPYFCNLKTGTSQYTRPAESAYTELTASPP